MTGEPVSAGVSFDCGCECRPAQHPAAAHGAWRARGMPVAVSRRAADVAGALADVAAPCEWYSRQQGRAGAHSVLQQCCNRCSGWTADSCRVQGGHTPRHRQQQCALTSRSRTTFSCSIVCGHFASQLPLSLTVLRCSCGRCWWPAAGAHLHSCCSPCCLCGALCHVQCPRRLRNSVVVQHVITRACWPESAAFTDQSTDWLCRNPLEQAQVPGPAWRLVHAAAAAFDSWVRSAALAVGSLRLKRRADPPDDLSIGGGGAAAFRSQVREQPQLLIAFSTRFLSLAALQTKDEPV